MSSFDNAKFDNSGGEPFALGPLPWKAFIEVVNAQAGKRAIIMNSGNWVADSAELLVDGAYIIGSPGTVIVSTMPFTGTQANSVFRAQATASGKTGTVTATVLRGSPTLGYTVVAGGAPVVGEVIAVSSGLSQQEFVIDAVAGVGPYTLTLDRPVTAPWLIGNPITVLSNRPSIIIEGNGMRVTGTGDRVVEITTGYQCRVSDIHYDTLGGAMGDIAFAYDIGGQECVFEDCSVDGDGAPAAFYGFALEANERSVINRCTVVRCSNVGVALIDCIACSVSETSISGLAGSHTGGSIGVGTAGGASFGCFDCNIDNCETQGGVFGFVITLSKDCSVTNSSFEYAANAGILFNAGTAENTKFTNVQARYCARGMNLTSVGNTGTQLTNVDFSNCTVYLLSTACDLDVTGFTAIGLSTVMGPAILCSGAGTLCRFRGLRYANSASSNVIQSSSNARIEVANANIDMGANSIALYGSAGGGLFIASNVRTAGSAVGTNGANLTATTLRRGEGINFTSTAVPIVLGAAGYFSVGQIVANGTGAAQAIAWPYLNAQDNVTVERIVGAAAAMPLVVNTPSVGFSLTFAAGDGATYQWSVN